MCKEENKSNNKYHVKQSEAMDKLQDTYRKNVLIKDFGISTESVEKLLKYFDVYPRYKIDE